VGGEAYFTFCGPRFYKTGRHDIAEILLKVTLNTKNSNSNFMNS